MGKRIQTGMSVGGSSILLIFVLLSLTTFAALSLVSANADYKLSDKNARAMQAYYTADGAAEEKLQQIDKALQKIPHNPDPVLYYENCARALPDAVEGVFAQGDVDGLIVRYTVADAATKRELQVELRFTQKADGTCDYRATCWKMVAPEREELPEEPELKLWDGKLPEA